MSTIRRLWAATMRHRLMRYFQNLLCALWVLFLAHNVLVSCAPNRIAPTIEPRPWPTTADITELERVVNEADGYMIGIVENAEQDWTYDDPCGFVDGVLGRCTDGRTDAYKLTIRDSGEPVQLYVFVPHGDTLVLPVGTQAVFIWQAYYAKRLQQCRAQRAMTLAYCPADQLPAVLSHDHVVAPGDSSLVASLFANKRRPR